MVRPVDPLPGARARVADVDLVGRRTPVHDAALRVERPLVAVHLAGEHAVLDPVRPAGRGLDAHAHRGAVAEAHRLAEQHVGDRAGLVDAQRVADGRADLRVCGAGQEDEAEDRVVAQVAELGGGEVDRRLPRTLAHGLGQQRMGHDASTGSSCRSFTRSGAVSSTGER